MFLNVFERGYFSGAVECGYVLAFHLTFHCFEILVFNAAVDDVAFFLWRAFSAQQDKDSVVVFKSGYMFWFYP